MDFTNKKWVKRLRIAFLISGVTWLLTVGILILLGLFGASVILAGIFLVVIALIAAINFQFVRIMANQEKLIVRYYSIFAVDRVYRMVEFPVSMLRKVEIRQYLLGLKLEVRFTVRVKKGLADYPWVCLSAMSFRERKVLVGALRNLVRQSNR